MNDDFLYKRQESPAPEFMAELQEELQSMDMPKKKKRKNGQRRFDWRAIAAVLVLTVVGLVILSQEKLRLSILNIFIEDPEYDLLADAYRQYDFELLDVPSRYQLFMAYSTTPSYTNGNYALIIWWQNLTDNCRVQLFVDFSLYSEYYQVPPQEVLELEDTLLADGVVGTWSEYIGGAEMRGKSIAWTGLNGIYYRIGAEEGCLSNDEMIAIAQSTLPENP